MVDRTGLETLTSTKRQPVGTDVDYITGVPVDDSLSPRGYSQR